MTGPSGETGETPQTRGQHPPSGGYEAPPIEQSPAYGGFEQPAAPSYPGQQPPGGFPPPPPPPPGGFAPPGGAYNPQYGGPYPPPAPGYAPPPMPAADYGTPYPADYGYPAALPAKTNTLAIISLVGAVVGLLCGVGSIIGIVCGAVALNQIKRTREGGHGLAVAGIVIGVASLVISIVWMTFAWN